MATPPPSNFSLPENLSTILQATVNVSGVQLPVSSSDIAPNASLAGIQSLLQFLAENSSRPNLTVFNYSRVHDLEIYLNDTLLNTSWNKSNMSGVLSNNASEMNTFLSDLLKANDTENWNNTSLLDLNATVQPFQGSLWTGTGIQAPNSNESIFKLPTDGEFDGDGVSNITGEGEPCSL